MKTPLFEVCLEGVDGVRAARDGGADRVELCAALVEGGVTPSHGTIAAALEVGIPTMVIIRPRGGDFLYTVDEIQVMERDIRYCREVGAHGVVFGALRADGSLARTQVQRLREAAGPLSVTFHRAFDVCRDPFQVLEELIEAGVNRILTSGQAPTVPEGVEVIRKLVKQAGERIAILPGCGIEPENVADVVARAGVTEFHATAFSQRESGMQHRNNRVYMGIPGLPEYERMITDRAVVERFMRAVGR
jgi:copper homeostasis protein